MNSMYTILGHWKGLRIWFWSRECVCALGREVCVCMVRLSAQETDVVRKFAQVSDLL